MVSLTCISMNAKRIRGHLSGAANAALILLVAILMVSGSSVVLLIYDTGQSEESPEIQTARWGDKVKVDYIGRLADGRVFDTSLWEVASNNALYPKSLSFNPRDQSSYTPLQVQIGTGSTIQGFENGLIGIDINETKVIEVSPSQGYGELDTSMLVTIPYVQTIPVFEDLNYTQYYEKFDTPPEVGLTLSDPVWGWEVTVLSVDIDANLVLVMNTPRLDAVYPVYGADFGLNNTGWHVIVDSYDSSSNGGRGEIVIMNLLEPEDVGMLKGIDSDANQFFLFDVDVESNTITLNYNAELVGQTLYFTVTLVEIL
jgi:FKBP-type peptidyl-prolyl cis-trans isomerase 2